MKTTKKAVSALLAVSLCLSAASAAFAEEDYDPDFELMETDEYSEEPEDIESNIAVEFKTADGDDSEYMDVVYEEEIMETEAHENEPADTIDEGEYEEYEEYEDDETAEDGMIDDVTDLHGVWKTDENDGMWMEADIEGDSITIEWVSGDDGKNRSIYWVGSYVMPEDHYDEFNWTSESDGEAMENVMFASSDTSKDFSYNNGVINVLIDAFGDTAEQTFYREEDEREQDFETMYYELLERYNQLQSEYDAVVNGNGETQKAGTDTLDELTDDVEKETEIYEMPESIEWEEDSDDGVQDIDDNAQDIDETTQDIDGNAEAADVTLGQQAALEKAESYVRTLSYSYTGLIEQLEFSGYSEEEATYAADNCGADWNEQALKKAQSYLTSIPYSYDGLIEQLEYNEFTTEQAVYAADNCGADWNEQAVKKAESYLNIMDYSRDKLISQLEYNGFTAEQAEYAADVVGF